MSQAVSDAECCVFGGLPKTELEADRQHRQERVAFLNREVTEVYLLLDYLSGRADRSLRPTQEEQARAFLDQRGVADSSTTPHDAERARIEADLADPTKLVLRTMAIRYPLKQEDARFAADAAFLLRARDVLNTRAAPATGATIAYTSLVCDRGAHDTGGERVTDFAKRAYPQFEGSARTLARFVDGFLVLLVAVLIAALALSAYAAWGKIMLDTLDAVRRDGSVLEQELGKMQSGLLSALQPGGPCDPDAVKNPSICARIDDLNTRYAATIHQLSHWEWLRDVTVTGAAVTNTFIQKQTEQWATAATAVLSNYLMPILYGLLGSIAYVLRRHYDRLAAHLLSPRDLRGYWIRFALGVLIGGCIGLVYSTSDAAQAKGILGAAATLSTSAIAFLAGYGVEGVFKTLDALLVQVFRTNGTGRPQQGAA